MDIFYKVIDEVKETIEQYGFNNTVTFGEVSEIDINKLTNFPLAHIKLESVTHEEKTIVFNLKIIVCDVLDSLKDKREDMYYRNSNMQDILNTQLVVATNLINKLRRLDLVDTRFARVDGSVTSEAFVERFENVLVGWEIDLDVTTFNGLGLC